jgi:hypothetical protein
MDPYEFARQQGQTIGSRANEVDEPTEVDNIMDLLIQAYTRAGHMTADVPEASYEAVCDFAAFANQYLAERRVVSTGIVDGAFSLVFDNGQAVPLATEAAQAPKRPDSTVPITTPREHKMKSMQVIDNSVPVTTGTVGSPTRRPKG